jgi:hypothetical protein
MRRLVRRWQNLPAAYENARDIRDLFFLLLSQREL